MPDSFACPECGVPIILPPYARGQRRNCPQCQTVVELPYLTRLVKPRKRRPLPGWAAVVVTGCLSVLLAYITFQMVRSRVKGERQNTLKQILLLVEEDERTGRTDAAVRRLDAALQLAAEPGLTSPGHVEELQAKRTRLATEQAERSEKQVLERVEADLVVAGTLVPGAQADPAPLLDLCERVLRAVQPLHTPRALAARQKVENLAGRIIEQRGIVVEPPRGVFVYEPDTVYRQAGLDKALNFILVGRGYLPVRENSPLTPLWNQSAPFKMAIELNETRAAKYMSSVLDTFVLSAELQFMRTGAVEWKNKLQGRTRQPCPMIPARLAGVLAIRTTRDLESERLFFNDAASELIGQLSKSMASFPAYVPNQPVSPGR